MTDTAKNSAAAEEGVYETPEDIAAEAAKTAERAARADADSPIDVYKRQRWTPAGKPAWSSGRPTSK